MPDLSDFWRGFLTAVAIPGVPVLLFLVVLAEEMVAEWLFHLHQSHAKTPEWYKREAADHILWWFSRVNLDKERQWEWWFWSVASRRCFLLRLIIAVLGNWRPTGMWLIRRFRARYGTKDAPKDFPAYPWDSFQGRAIKDGSPPRTIIMDGKLVVCARDFQELEDMEID